jgi:hypothetical protein
MLYRSISIMEKGMHNGLEVRESRDKKIQKMQRLLQLLDNKINDRYIELAEAELGMEYVLGDFEFKKIDRKDLNGESLYEMLNNISEEDSKNNTKISHRSKEIEELQWKEIWRILEGQDIGDYTNQISDVMQVKETENSKEKDWFDGTGLRGWWD